MCFSLRRDGKNFTALFCDSLLEAVGYPADCIVDEIVFGSVTVRATIVFTSISMDLSFDMGDEGGMIGPAELQARLTNDAATLFSESFLETFGDDMVRAPSNHINIYLCIDAVNSKRIISTIYYTFHAICVALVQINVGLGYLR
jgi:hypothetical protein